MSEYQLSSILTQGRVVHLAVIGCGGTGSAFASGLPYLHQAMRALGLQGLQVTLVDGDLISETNCVRQPFSRGEVGLHKSIVLASRLNQFWGLNWEAAPEYLTGKSKLNADIVVGCVDTRNARKLIHNLVTARTPRWSHRCRCTRPPRRIGTAVPAPGWARSDQRGQDPRRRIQQRDTVAVRAADPGGCLRQGFG